MKSAERLSLKISVRSRGWWVWPYLALIYLTAVIVGLIWGERSAHRVSARLAHKLVFVEKVAEDL